MCGITAIIGEKNKPDLERMLAVVARRGPEGRTTGETKHAQFGHALLGFVQEGENPQPFIDGNATFVWNGEIYNWKELNQKYQLGASTDTQTLLRGVRKKGKDFLLEIDGQYAFVADINGNIVVGRDLYGICPLAFGHKNNAVYIASTTAALSKVGIFEPKTVPGGTFGTVEGGDINLVPWKDISELVYTEKRELHAEEVLETAEKSVCDRITENQDVLFTTMGGIDSQFVSATVARATKGAYGGAITIVPWKQNDIFNMDSGDYFAAKATVEMLAQEGITLKHQVVQLDPSYVREAIDRVVGVLGPDYFNVCCGLAEDLVASTAKRLGGKAVMTAGGPDEAGWSYKPWALKYKNRLEEGFAVVSDQFTSSEGVRAGLVFGEHGLENRVPLAFLIEKFMSAPQHQKAIVSDWGDLKDPFSIKMKDKILWREAIKSKLPEYSLNQQKAMIHASTGAKEVLYEVARRDEIYLQERTNFINSAKNNGWDYSIIFAPLSKLDQNNMITEGQLYCLYSWSRVAPEEFKAGSFARYGHKNGGIPRYSYSVCDKVKRPLCFDWMTLPEVKV
ncbi:asparagine synthetase B [Candidatus Woesearchaeota archaeon]|nr:asparagine synthetase B [Candidatus Woesearchaeota archaeon]